MNDPHKVFGARTVRVGEESSGQRIDNFLARVLRGVPRSHLYRIVRSGEVRANGRRVAPSHKVTAGDEIRIPPVRTGDGGGQEGSAPTGRTPEILFEDEWLIAANKPAGLAVHGGSGVDFGLIELMRHRRPDARFLELAHRLDRETSGVILMAKKRQALLGLHQQLREGRMSKRYWALVSGRWMTPEQSIELALHKFVTAEGERRVSVREDGMKAHTVARLRCRWANFSLLDVELLTGRTHQIRVHLAHLGFPLCGDDKYGDFEVNHALRRVGLRRMFLHAAEISFAHPISGDPMRLEALLPRELAEFLKKVCRNEPTEYGTPL